ncbi:MAG: bifunctional [glutamine synthetase] adenylyltransferase/[glutamine synthetase]-adenylyl-L-tyrosine phosphorylase [Propionibacteriaceae bacterium]|nr:bifunctional [glutamine synthetase] adenylyltransferase/[glutamine synthetase]-adenylyl-L-tyrosine phosphorylase [Propionibacteriaceae bacterium]
MTTPWTRGDLARLGFLDSERTLDRAERLDGIAPGLAERLVPLCGGAADPDQALAAVAAIAEVAPELPRLTQDDGFARRLVAVAGASAELGRWLAQRPAALQELVGDPGRRDAATLKADLLQAVTNPPPGTTAPDQLRHSYRHHLVRIAARDLTADDPAALLESVTGELADLADATVQAALAHATTLVPDADQVRLAVFAMGKAGAQELNYVSDVDLIYVAEPALDDAGQPVTGTDQAIATATRLVAALTQTVTAATPAGTIWPIDANLRPEGSRGPLVRSLASMKRYYGQWAENWEFQALLKARPMAGDAGVAKEFLDLVTPLVWTAAQRPHFMANTQAMRRRVIDHIPPKEAGREIKLGEGGLRDTEFSVQLLQLVHGRTDERLRLRGTLTALQALIDHGYIGRTDGPALGDAYRFQRLLEHRVQLWQLKRTHLMPEAADRPGLLRLARSVGLHSPDDVLKRWRDSTLLVRRLHQRVFYSPLLEAVARIPSDEVRLTTEAARDRLQVLGYGDPAAALRHIEALTSGLSRPAEIQRQLLPALLGWIAAGPNPDMGLLAFRQVSEALGHSPFYLRALRDEGATAQRLARVLSSSRYATNLLLRAPAAVELLAHDEIEPGKDRASLVAEMTAAVGHHGLDNGSGGALRAVRRRELVRVAMSDLLGEADIRRVGHELADIADASIEAALTVARREVPDAPAMAVIALGRWGGDEMSYASDADVLYVVEDSDDPASIRRATEVVTAMRRLLHVPGPDPDLVLDADLRPEGKDGPLVRSLSSCLKYYSRWSSAWEAQALIRARHGAGDPALGAALLEGIAGLRYPAGGVTPEQLMEMRKLKGRMEAERLPRGRARDHVKLGRGGLTDVEWTVQLVQLQHAHAVPELRTTSTLGALDAAVAAGLVAADDAADLAAAWLLASRIRNAIMLARDTASDVLPSDAHQAAQVAQLLGYGKGQASQLTEDWGQTALRSKKVVNRLFWGLDE